MNFEGIKTLDITEDKDVNEIALRENSNIKQAISNIYLGKATIDDYLALGLTNVKTDNLIWINAEGQDRGDLTITEDKVDQRKTSIINDVNSVMKDYPVVKTINDGKETCD